MLNVCTTSFTLHLRLLARLIIDLSAPHSSTTPSLNSLIPSSEFSLQYATVDNAIQAILEAGRAAWLSKTDISNAFKLLPLHPSLWHLHGVWWKGLYYFANRLTFGAKSSPKLFDIFAETLCWLLLNICCCPVVIHYLDDFLTVEKQDTIPHSINKTVALFKTLGVPVAENKTVGPTTKLTFLGIDLDSAAMQASLPADKVQRIRVEIGSFLDNGTTSRKDLQSLLGSLNFAMRIIPQGRAFISRLLRLLPDLPNDDSRVTLDSQARADLTMWHHFLSDWNGRNLFIPPLTLESPVLWTDAAGQTGFAAIFENRWLRDAWPSEAIGLPAFTKTSALFEIYPIVAAAKVWGYLWGGKAVKCYSDNTAACEILNKGRSSSLIIMSLVRRLTWLAATHNFFLTCIHIPGHQNTAADALSRSKLQVFRELHPTAEVWPSKAPQFRDLILD
ncbi:uncharacterized protein LOC134586340 [Pelobates fuscus]|uniref:uncharacterized protein LOC134586340 n=1 Tax=Pelobates fuscus TaxID=191477 RepID=UPI002FE46A31